MNTQKQYYVSKNDNMEFIINYSYVRSILY